MDGVLNTSGVDASATGEEDIADGVFLGFHTRLFFRSLGDETEYEVFPEGVTIAFCLGGWFFQYPDRLFLSNSFFMNAFMKVIRLSFFCGGAGVFCWIGA